MERELYQAVRDGKVEEVEEIFRKDPTLNVNWRNGGNGHTALRIAIQNGYDAIASILLAHPDIDANMKSFGGWTPFMFACFERRTSCVRLLLKDSRVKVNEPNMFGYTPLWYAAAQGNLAIIKWWIASGREMGLGRP